MSVGTRHHVATIPGDFAGMRFDRALAHLFSEYSRARIQTWIKEGHITVAGKGLRPRDLARGGERVHLVAEVEDNDAWEPEALPLSVVHEDQEIIVVDKPAGLVTHPGAGNRRGTLVNALLHHDPQLAGIPRAGIVHRIDKDTSGLLVVARTLQAHKRLVELLKEHDVAREYDAVAVGAMLSGGRVDAPVGRHRAHRTRMAVTHRGRAAVSHYRVRQRFPFHTHLRVHLETGRTHQIRVHMAHIGHPLVGDPVYGGRVFFPKGAGETLVAALRGFGRQALHASRLSFAHPASGKPCVFESPLPDDFARLLHALSASG